MSDKQKLLVREQTLVKELGIGRSTIRRMVEDGTFPAPIQISPRTIGWIREEIESWINTRKRIKGTENNA